MRIETLGFADWNLQLKSERNLSLDFEIKKLKWAIIKDFEVLFFELDHSMVRQQSAFICLEDPSVFK